MIRVVLDTSVLISGLLSSSGAPAEILRRWRDGAFDVIVSPLLLDEVRRALAALANPRIATHVLPEEAEAFLATVSRTAVHVPDPQAVEAVTRDPADDYLVALAREGGAHALISVDRDLLDASDGFAISPRAFLEKLG